MQFFNDHAGSSFLSIHYNVYDIMHKSPTYQSVESQTSQCLTLREDIY